MIKLISSSSSSLLSWRAWPDKAKAGTVSVDVTSSTVQLCLSQGNVCVCLCVCLCLCEATLSLFLVVLEGCVLLQREAGLTELRLSAYLPFAGGLPQPFSPSPASDCSLHTHTHTHTCTDTCTHARIATGGSSVSS